jgi:subtilisin family serine protease
MIPMRTPSIRFVHVLVLGMLFGGAGWILSDGVLAQGFGGQRLIERLNGHDAVAGEVIVKYFAPKTASERAQTDAIVAASKDDDLGNSGGRIRHIRSTRYDAATLVSYFQGAPGVEYAEPNYIVYAIATPNDVSFPSLWGLLNNGQATPSAGTAGADIDATLAWNITTGSASNVVGVVDTGVDYNHPDLVGNIWSAPASFTVNIGGLNITCPAGSHGFNALTNSCDPKDDNNHGTHVSGTIGARGNNGTGVTGINWTASIMGLKFLSASGSGSTTGAINAIAFAIQAKQRFGAAADVRVLSNSWGGGGFSQSLLNKINEANGNRMLFVAAAGNANTNNDSVAFYPANYNAPNVVSVAATDNKDLRASFSNFGANTVHLGAPGVSILSTTMNNGYASFNGTSMATPHVSGVAALVLSACWMETATLKSLLLGTVDAVASMSGITVTGGRLNASKALVACTSPATPTNLIATAGNAQVALQWNASLGSVAYIIRRGTSSGTEIFLNWTTQTSFTDATAVSGTKYYYVVKAVNANGAQSGQSTERSATPQ